MKKVLSILLLLLLCASLFACTTDKPSEQDTQAEQTDPGETTTEEATKEETTPGQEETTDAPEPPAPSPVKLYQLAPEKNSMLQSYVI